MYPDLIAPFSRSIETSSERLRSICREGHRVLGYFCTYTPVEILYAAGFVPIRLYGGPGNAEKVPSLIPDFICPYMRMTLERALAGEYDFLSGIIQGYTCDAACGLTNIWEENIGGDIYHMIPLPYRNAPAARAFLRSALEELIEKLEKAGGASVDPERLLHAERLYTEIRERLRRLYDLGKQNRLPFGWNDLAVVVTAGGLTPPETYIQMLENLENRLPRESIDALSRKTPVLVSGSLIEDFRILAAVETAGGRIVGDDLCNGYRPLDPPEGTGASPIDRLIDRHFQRFPCPARSRIEERMPRLITHCRDVGAKAVLFMVQKFCTPHLSDYPMAAEELKRAGFPSILIELDETGQTQGQVQTRLESFFEMFDNPYAGDK